MVKKFSSSLPALISSTVIFYAAFLSHTATRMLNDSLQEMGGSALPIPTVVALACFEYSLVPGLALVSLCLIGLIEWKIQERSRRMALEVYILSAFLLLTTALFWAMALPFACFCETI